MEPNFKKLLEIVSLSLESARDELAKIKSDDLPTGTSGTHSFMTEALDNIVKVTVEQLEEEVTHEVVSKRYKRIHDFKKSYLALALTTDRQVDLRHDDFGRYLAYLFVGVLYENQFGPYIGFMPRGVAGGDLEKRAETDGHEW